MGPSQLSTPSRWQPFKRRVVTVALARVVTVALARVVADSNSRPDGRRSTPEAVARHAHLSLEPRIEPPLQDTGDNWPGASHSVDGLLDGSRLTLWNVVAKLDMDAPHILNQVKQLLTLATLF